MKTVPISTFFRNWYLGDRWYRDDVVAGSIHTWTLTFTVGKHGIDDGGHIKVVWRDVSDWKRPQFNEPRNLNYTTVATTGKAKLDVCFDNRDYIH